jgi:hypothetical protein
MMRRRLAFTAVFVLATGCSPDAEPPAKRDAKIATGNVTEIIVPDGNVTANAAAVEGGPAIDLAPDELTIVLPGGSTRHVAFGLGKAEALAMLKGALGDPIEQAVNQECGPGPLAYAAFRDGLSVYFQDGKFAGWDLDGRDGGKFTTMNGIGLGSTRKGVEDSGTDVSVAESSIGTEFRMGAMSGLLDGKGADAKVTNLWAGVTCIAR